MKSQMEKSHDFYKKQLGYHRIFLSLLIAFALSACGGGGDPAPVTPAPGGVSALAGDSQNQISWTAVSGATSYNIYWSTSSAVSKASAKIASVSSPYSQTGLTNGTRYYYVVTAVGAAGESAESSSASAMPLGAPTNVSVTARDGNNIIGWTAAPGASSYNIYWSTSPSVNKANGTKIALANNPQTHTGLANGSNYYYIVTAVDSGSESAESAQASATPTAAPVVADPLYPDQWHLKNTGQPGATGVAGVIGEDLNVEPAWATSKGAGVRIAIVDDGLEIGHEDLASNIAATGQSYNYVTGSTDPTYDATDITSGHGTAVAGIAAARDLNGLGVRGVAPRANLVGYNLLQYMTLSNEADAMTRGSPDVHISSNSWGADDDGDLHEANSTWRAAIEAGLANGRNGLGTIYTWAGGNGGYFFPADNSNYDGQANYRGVIAVAAVNDQGKQSSYSEPGANLWISAPGGEFCDTHTITTTDRTGVSGENPSDSIYGYVDYTGQNYTKCMNGTSSATPEIAGVAALMLQANPSLGWRDVRLILAQSARKNDPTDAGWTAYGATVAPYHFSHKYGFGVVDALAAVTLAQTWVNVGPQLTYTTALASPYLAIQDNNLIGRSNTIAVSNSGITNIEFIEITFSAADHTYAGDLTITLTSPSGTVSQLSETHACPNNVCTAYSGWVFGSARHLGEAANGNWTLTVKDEAAQDTGHFQSWKLKFYGR
jgi:kexin